MKIQIFQKFRDATYLQPQRIKIIIPAFTLSVPTWAGSSVVIAEFPIENSNYYFSFKLPIKAFGENFIAAIRWKVGDVCYRFKFWDDADGVLYYPIYAGERIGVNAILEIWSIDSEDTPALDAANTLHSSQLVFADGDNAGCYCCADPSGEINLEQSEVTPLPPYAFCNPFCDNLC